MKTIVKTQHGDKMELLTDNNGNKIKTQGKIKTRDEKLTLWKVSFIILDNIKLLGLPGDGLLLICLVDTN